MARNPLGGGHLRRSALSFVGDDRPDRRPPRSAPISHNCPPRDLRDFYHGLLSDYVYVRKPFPFNHLPKTLWLARDCSGRIPLSAWSARALGFQCGCDSAKLRS